MENILLMRLLLTLSDPGYFCLTMPREAKIHCSYNDEFCSYSDDDVTNYVNFWKNYAKNG